MRQMHKVYSKNERNALVLFLVMLTHLIYKEDFVEIELEINKKKR